MHPVVCHSRKIYKWDSQHNKLLKPRWTFFLIGIVGGGVQLGPLGTAATNRPIVPAPGDYDDGEVGGMMIGRGSRSIYVNPKSFINNVAHLVNMIYFINFH
jgi:hypothetical protein